MLMTARSLKKVGLAGLFALLSLAAKGAGLTLAWDPSLNPTVAGCFLYWGVESQVYSSSINAGATTSATISNLVPGVTYYFAVTAYDANYVESPFSPELTFTVPPPGPLLDRPTLVTGGCIVSGTAPVGYQYDVLATTDFVRWDTLGNLTVEVNGRFNFQDPETWYNPRRFYRLRQTLP
jgi:hypothetical protein